MKKLFKTFIFVLPFVLFSCANNPKEDNAKDSFNNFKAIHNFSTYKGIGVGTSNFYVNRKGRSIYSDDDLKLIGQKEDGSIEIITFDDETGIEHAQTYHLSCYTDRASFIFLGFSEYKVSVIESDNLYSHTINYLLDKKNGNLYSLEFEDSMFDIGPEYEGKVLVGTKINGIQGMYFCSIENEMLKIELIADYDTIPVQSYSIRLKSNVDRYGNFFINESSAVQYIVTKNGKIKKVSNDLYLCINGIYYNSFDSSNITHWIDENGNYITASYIPNTFISKMLPTEYLLGSTSNDLVCYKWEDIYDWTTEKQMIAIGKITFENSSKLNYTYSLDSSSYENKYKETYISYCFNNTGKVIFISDDLSVVTILNVTTGEYKDIISLSDVLRIKSTTKDKYDNIVISYVDNDLNTINYYIDTDGNYSTSFKEPEYIVKYISPIN